MAKVATMARSRYWRIRSNVYKFLEQRTGTWNMVFHLMVFAFVLLALGLSSLLKEEDEINHTPLQRIHNNMEVALAVYFGAEFLIRLWAVGADARYQGCYGRLRFLGRFVCVVDLIILAASMFLLALSTEQGKAFGSGMVQYVKLLQMLRLLHFDRQMSTWRMIRDMIRMSRFELVSAYYITFLIFLALSASVFIAESYNDTQLMEANSEIKSTFRSYGDAMWFSVISLMTVGYGDIVPRAWSSKFLTCVLGFCAYCMFTTSSTLIGVGLTLMVQDKNKEKLRQKVRNHAARVVQSWYRHHLLSSDKYKNIGYFRETLFRKLYTYEKLICKPQELALLQQQKLKNRRPSALTQSLLKQMRKKSLFEPHHRDAGESPLELGMSVLPALLQQGDIIAPVCAAVNDRRTSHHQSNTLSPVDSPVRKISFVDRMALVYNKTATVVDKQPHPVGMGRSVSTGQFYYNSTPPSLTQSSTKELPTIVKSNEMQPAKNGNMFTVSVDSDAEKGYGSEAGTPVLTPNRSRANSVDMIMNRSRQASIAASIDWNEESMNERTIRKYGILMQFIYYLRFLANKSRFNRARNPWEIKDIETELREMEVQRMSKLKELQTSVEAAMGAPLQSLLSKETTRLSIARRLELCEQKLADIERQTSMVLHLSDAIARQLTPTNVAPSLKLTTPAQRTRLLQRKNAFTVRPDFAHAS